MFYLFCVIWFSIWKETFKLKNVKCYTESWNILIVWILSAINFDVCRQYLYISEMSVVVTDIAFVIYSVWCVGDGRSLSGAVPISSTACLEFGTTLILVFVLLSKRNVICLSVESKKNSIKAGKDIPCFLSCLIYNLCYWYWKKVKNISAIPWY